MVGLRSVGPSASEKSLTVSASFANAGLVVFRYGGDYLLITNGVVGTAGFGNHNKRPARFRVSRRGCAGLVDPGSYVYTSDLTRATCSEARAHTTRSAWTARNRTRSA